jgi:curved DNA-binding protein
MAVAYQDYYEALGVPRDASEQQIRSAYRKLAREHHPDVNKDPGAEDRFKQISEAYEVLRDEDKRERYDRLGADWKAGQDVPGGHSTGGYGEAFRGGDGFSDVRVDFGGGDFSDFFESFFGGQGARAGGGGRAGANGFALRGADQEATLELTLEEAAAGGKRRLSLGDGRDFDVDIPRGVRGGQRIRLAGQGEPGGGGAPAGDLFLRVRVKRHPLFRAKGDDLYVDLPVSPWEAALGAEVPVRTLSGMARVRVPPDSSSGRRLRLRGEGLPRTSGAAGDLHAVVMVRVPKQLEQDERDLFEQLAATSKFDPRKER